MPELFEPLVRVSRYSVSCVPPQSHHLATHLTLYVSDMGGDRWEVTNLWGECLSAGGRWDDRPRPACRPDGWEATHYFDVATALRMAKQAAPGLTVNGRTVADVLARGVAGGRTP